MLKPGDAAPDFSLKDQDGRTVRLSDQKGHPVLLYFYPKADTPGCTTQACSIRDADLAGNGLIAFGVSPDEPESQKRFDSKYRLGFPLLSDPDHAVAESYGAWGERNRQGTITVGIIRSSFLIEAGKIRQAWYGVSPADTVPNALAELG